MNKEALLTDHDAPGAVVERLSQATNAHDLEALAACFALEYRNDTPVHPARGFEGRGQVRKNWQQIFAAVPDITTSVHWVADGSTVWSEWEMRGTRRDGLPHLMRGVILFGIHHGEATWARFYLEPVEDSDTAAIDQAVRIHVGTAHDSDGAGVQSQSSSG
jgi:ketosteroid isomerase-like protein